MLPPSGVWTAPGAFEFLFSRNTDYAPKSPVFYNKELTLGEATKACFSIKTIGTPQRGTTISSYLMDPWTDAFTGHASHWTLASLEKRGSLTPYI